MHQNARGVSPNGWARVEGLTWQVDGPDVTHAFLGSVWGAGSLVRSDDSKPAHLTQRGCETREGEVRVREHWEDVASNLHFAEPLHVHQIRNLRRNGYFQFTFNPSSPGRWRRDSSRGRSPHQMRFRWLCVKEKVHCT